MSYQLRCYRARHGWSLGLGYYPPTDMSGWAHEVLCSLVFINLVLKVWVRE